MSLNINCWKVELSEDDTESDLNYENLDNSLFSSSAIRQIANTNHSCIPVQSSFSTSEITLRIYFSPCRPSTKLCNLKNHFDKTILTQYPCVQYVTTHQLAKYMTKYVTKSELTEYFDISESDAITKHILARCLGSMELMITSRNTKHLLMAPTGVAATNINGQTIHSALHIRNIQTHFETLSNYNQQQKEELSQIKTIIIDEISMVSAELITFISLLLFARINNTPVPFGRIPTLLIGDLAQLSPIRGQQVFYAPGWQEFFPLFLTTAHQQQDNKSFYDVLEKIRLGNISSQTRQMINEKVLSYHQNNDNLISSIDTTYIVGFRHEAPLLIQMQ